MASPNTRFFSLKRAALALFAGAVTGAFLTAFAYALPENLADITLITLGSIKLGLVVGLVVAGVAFVVFSAGLLVVGIPVWAWCHKKNYTKRRHAIIMGAVLVPPLPVITRAVTVWPGITDSAIGNILIYLIFHAAMFAIIGAIVGNIIWRLTYGCTKRRAALTDIA